MTCGLINRREGRCEWCSKKLKGRQRRWCSRRCSSEHTANHRWTQAKAWIKKHSAWFRCELCKEFFVEVDVQVDHIKPALGKHSQWGCHHHQENLRILCIPCHKKVTRRQHAEGVFR